MSNGVTNSAALAVGGRGNPRSSGYQRVANDWYLEPTWLVEALLDVERFYDSVWDPACGSGNIPQACTQRGIQSFASDIVDRGYGSQFDFLACKRAPWPAANLVTNPPFNLAEEFVRHALTLVPGKVAIVQRLAFLEGQKRKRLFEASPIARIWVSSRRACMPPGVGFTDGQGAQWGALRAQEGRGSAIAYAWFVWDPTHSGPPTLGWLP